MSGATRPTTGQAGPDEVVGVEALPKEAGLFLILIGVGGVLLPGPVGTPFLVLGVFVFFPTFFKKFDQGLARRFPKSHQKGMKQVHRFVNDLERRYPSSV
jgi:hypothetical protein